VALLSVATIVASDARPRHAQVVCDKRGCSSQPANTRVEVQRVRRASLFDEGTVVGRRPSGCPYEFCGCEASLYLFGEIRPELNLASNWIRKFPRTSPAPGMAAAREGHVMVLMKHVSGNDWLVHDGNSGSHLTRNHVRSIRGYVIVDPQVTMIAKRKAPAHEEKTASIKVANATPIPLPRERAGAAAIEELAALQTKRAPFPPEWMASVPLEEVPTIKLEHVATISVDQIKITPRRIANASLTPIGETPVEHVAAIAAPEVTPPQDQTASIAPERTPPAIPADKVPVPRQRIAAVTPEQRAAIPAGRVPMPRQRVAAIAPAQIAALPADRVPLPRHRVATAPFMQTASLPTKRVPMPRVRMAARAPEPIAVSHDGLADVHLKAAAAVVVLPKPAEAQRMAAVPTETALAAHPVRVRHARRSEPTIIERAASAVDDAVGFVKGIFGSRKHHHRS
jgi:hypothetical protein